MRDLRVRDLIGNREKIYSVDADDTSDVAALKLRNLKVRTLGATKNGGLVGVIGQSDLANKVVAMSRNPSEVKVSEIMSTKIVTVQLDSSFFECLELMDTYHIAHLIILDDNGKYYGMLSWKDLERRLVEELKNQLEWTQEYAFGPNCNLFLEQSKNH